ncbi:MAG TPA: TraR/DksA family transcriptional regulator [Candidatus Acidoferrales bacterium]|nr:TraR/DksA family transcriptional regulator [Candidatus Acidoferrales bacterium]
MPTLPKVSARKYEALEKALTSQRDELSVRLNTRLGEVFVDREPDDEAALASDSTSKDLAVATLERERRMLDQVKTALERIKSGDYGICESCGGPIPDARLRALPWAKVCIRCAERAQTWASAAD